MNAKYIKWGIGVFFIGMLICFLLIPSMIAYFQAQSTVQETTPSLSNEKFEPIQTAAQKQAKPVQSSEPVIAVYRTSQEKIEKVKFNQYLFGVLAGEMPASFELEALKAQAVAARTYIVKLMSSGSASSLPKGADVTDTVMHQVYYSDKELKKIWGDTYASKAAKIKKAIAETDDLVLTYQNEPIRALFFSTSNGRTENAEEYWKNAVPYLKSVPSPWDAGTPKFHQEKKISRADLNQKLGVAIQTDDTLMTRVKRTTGQAIASTKIGGKTFTGREIREKLGLASSDFTMKWKNGKILVMTKGYGHQVGMSQYGANEMAKEGKTFRDILFHYYTGVSLENGLSFFVDGKL